MLAWKVCIASAATALLATAAGLAEDGPATIIVNSGQAADSAATITGSGTVTLSGVIANGEKGDKGGNTMTLTFGNADDAGAVVAMQSDYWLGVIASHPTPALAAQLKLPKDQGLVVEVLEPESPAAKAGVKQYDILLKGNDKPLTNLHDLYQLMSEVKEGKLKLDLLRAGTHETVTVTPAKRPAHANVQFGEGPGAAVAGWSSLGGPIAIEERPIRFRVVGPGTILPPGGPMTRPLNTAAAVNLGMHIETKLGDGSKVELTQNGPGSAKVVVTRDKEKWEGTSDDLSKIPKEVRPEIEKLLHQAANSNVFYATQGMAGGVAGPTFVARSVGMPLPPGMPVPFAVSPDVEKRLGEMQKEIDELRHTVEALKGKDKAAPKAE